MNLKPMLNANKGGYEIEKFDEVKLNVKQFIIDLLDRTPQISDAESLKAVKDNRTELRSRKEEITKARLQINEIYFGTFNSQLKEIERMLKEADDTLKASVDSYNESIGNVKPKSYKLEIVGYDANAIKQIKELAVKLNLQVKEK